ncbi:AI-2E family transporter [Clostridium sp. AM33-3]|nr:AI-2E family transporter [Clostridium sp. AM33-3]RHT22060.1 AI-2E family transporter [Clostridium sp. AM33-3]
MKNDKYRTYIYWGVTALTVLLLLVAAVFVVMRWSLVAALGAKIANILAPVIYGAVFAYLLNPVYNRVQAAVMKMTEKIITQEEGRKRLGGFLGTLASLFLLIAVVVGLISMLIPQLINSIRGVMETLPASINNLEIWLEKVLADNPDLEQQVMQHYGAAADYLQNWLTNVVVPNIYRIIGSVSSGVVLVVRAVFDILIGLIVMVYLLNMKEKLLAQAKMIIYGLFPLKIANKVIEEGRYVHQVFGGFIIGKLLDSLIIGLICFVLLGFANMPYVLLVSVIVGVTNVIPFFGPFIGAIPSAFLILLSDPMKCLYFLIFILLLQQFDGNILGPKILGDSTGLSSFWVLFSILLFGGLMGFVGMIIAVPTFAVIYRLVTEYTTWKLGKKALSGSLDSYDRLDYIDETEQTYMKK